MGGPFSGLVLHMWERLFAWIAHPFLGHLETDTCVAYLQQTQGHQDHILK